MSDIANPFGPDTANTPSSERIDSALQNFIEQFFGTVTKTQDAEGVITWALPSPLDLEEPIPGYPREEGEGLGGYLARVMTDGVNAVAGANGFATTTASYGTTAQPVVGQQVSFEVDSDELFSEGAIVYIPGGGYYQVFEVVPGAVSLTNLYSSTDILHPGQRAAGSFFPDAPLKIFPCAPVGATGDQGEPGETGDTGPAVSLQLDNVTIEFYTDVSVEPNVIRIRVADASITPTKVSPAVRNGSTQYGVDVGAVDGRYVITTTPTTTALVAGARFSFYVPTARNNVGATTSLSVDGIEKNLYYNGLPTTAGRIPANRVVDVIYDGVQFQIQTPVSLQTSFRGDATALPGASTASTPQAHGLVTVPESIRGVLVCVSAPGGSGLAFAVGDEVNITNFYSDSAPTQAPAFSVVADATYLTLVQAADATPSVVGKTGTAAPIVPASWNFKLYAAKLIG